MTGRRFTSTRLVGAAKPRQRFSTAQRRSLRRCTTSHAAMFVYASLSRLEPDIALLDALDELLRIEFPMAHRNLEQPLRLRRFRDIHQIEDRAAFYLNSDGKIEPRINPAEIR